MDIGYALNAFYPVIGGTETYMLNLINFISDYHNVHVYTTNATSSFDFRFIKYSNEVLKVKHQKIGKIDVYRDKVTQLPVLTAKGFVQRFTDSYRSNQETQNVLTRQATVILNWGFSLGMCRRLLHDQLDVIHFATLPFLHTYTDSLISWFRSIPSIFFPCFHRFSDHEAYVNKIPFRFASKIIALTHEEKREIIRLFKIPGEKIDVIPSPIEIDEFMIDIKADHFPELRERDGIPKILFIGRLSHNKGFVFLVETMLDLWKQNIDVDLIFVGTPTEELNTLQPVLHKYPDHVFHYQNITQEEKVQLLRLSDVVVLPSIVESWGRVFLEGWSQKKPVIGAKGMVYEELIKNDENGFTVPFMDKNALGEKIKLLIGDSKMRKRMGEAGYQLVMDNFTLDKILPKFLTIYDELSRK
ncbi:MAG TPA: glycosyltransferase family 4 protein [Candidatus Lokiarchaeia archaeon]|nr:glycosyltransferase family 4 protein [Candidatus Lokiarchaeia archaeon]